MTPQQPTALDALGRIVRDLRLKKGLTQDQLGLAAGYQKGAGVSISRLENGRLQPTDERFEGIARELGLSAEALTELADNTRSAPPALAEGDLSAEQRIARIEQEVNRRSKLLSDLAQAFSNANDRAKDRFLMRLVQVATRVNGAAQPDLQALDSIGQVDADDIDVEVACGLELTKIGVAQALAPTSGVAGVAGTAVCPTFAAAVAGSAASLAAGISEPTRPAATNGLLAALRVGRSAEGSAARLGRLALLAGLALPGLGVGAALMAKQRSRRHQREVEGKLEEAEAHIAQDLSNVDSLRDIMSEGTDLLEYVAVHAAHALERWDAHIGPGAREWQSLDVGAQQRYQDFVSIAAAELAVAALDFEALMTARGAELERSVAFAHQLLARARQTVMSLV